MELFREGKFLTEFNVGCDNAEIFKYGVSGHATLVPADYFEDVSGIGSIVFIGRCALDKAVAGKKS